MPREKLFQILGICMAVILLLTPLLIWLINPGWVTDLLYAPIKIQFTDQSEKKICEYAGIAIPEQAQFVTGYAFPSQDSIYICSPARLPQKLMCAGNLVWRIMPNMGGLSPIEESLYNWCFEDLEYSFSHVITYSQRPFTEICYGTQEEAVYVAVVYSDI